MLCQEPHAQNHHWRPCLLGLRIQKLPAQGLHALVPPREARNTDDTSCTIAVADALLSSVHPKDKLQEWCRRYADIGGWGQRFALWIFDDDAKSYSSWGNGAAMRISLVGYLAGSEREVLDWADTITLTTQNHPDPSSQPGPWSWRCAGPSTWYL